MLKIEKFVTASPEQWEIVIEGMRNPHNSWDRMDSYSTHIEDPETLETAEYAFFVGENDQTLMESLACGGPVHAKYRRMLPVWVTINAPLYWWKEFDTYKVGTVCNSCSTMHKIHAKEFELSDFSCEHLFTEADIGWGETVTRTTLEAVIHALNIYREKYIEGVNGKTQFDMVNAKYYWWQMIQLLPSSYNQKRTIFMNYEVLANIYRWRRNHKLDEWHTFCDWIEELPYSELITRAEEVEV